jgi:hypothetical protein
MKCHQCDTAAIYRVGGDRGIALCLSCFSKLAHIQQQEIENQERMMNYASDQMFASYGMPPVGPRFSPRPIPVVIEGTTLHNIHVTNSVVGAINTGSIGTVDQSISSLIQCGEPELAQAIKALSEAILQSGDLTSNQKNELVESLSVISKEAASPKEWRQNTVASALLEKAMKVTALANDITDVCQKWWPVLLAVFAGAGG